MNTKVFLVLALVVLASTASFAATPEEFSAEKIQGIWPELWKIGAHEIKAPAIDALSEQQVVKEMTGHWVLMSGPLGTDKIHISLETNRQVTVSGMKDGKAWEADGLWQLISNKLVLFIKSANELPGFIFRIKGKPYMFDPWSGTLMSELKREQVLGAPSKAGGHDRQIHLQPVQLVNGKISRTNILTILNSMDNGFRNKDATAIFAGYASNAIIIATVVEGPRTITMTNNTSSYRRDVEAGFKSFGDDYKLQRKDVTTAIAPDGQKATSQSTLVETYVFLGKTKRAVSHESDTFEVNDGKVWITRMNSKVTIE